MKTLPSVKDLSVKQKTVLLRTNYDVSLKDGEVTDGARIDESLPTINYLLDQQAKIILLSHLGRPEGKVNPGLSLKPVVNYLGKLLKKEVPLFSTIDEIDKNQPIVMLENLRFWLGEENNDLNFAKSLANLGDFFVNDAFACSHRQHTSIVSLPQFLPSALGLDFLKEVEVLSRVRENPRRPVTLILGGVKKDKLEVIEKLLNWVDAILIGGKLPQLISQSYPAKVIMAGLNPDGKDITLESVEKFKKIIVQSGTIIWAGPMGFYEEENSQEGTKQIAEAIVSSQAFKVVGGGDTEAALTKFNLVDKIDYISSGGGAMFEFLAQGTLPGIEAIINNQTK
ncbi:phosphoglycerate kinase [Patescibacteria group bacterium]|nr:phosphoglycerate kinase [Patescibacteria group bacterium]